MNELRKNLLRQMEALRRTIDPKLLNRAKLAAFGKVPYDRDAAKQAVGAFLEKRDDDGAFRRKLEEALKREGETLDLTPEAPAEKDGGKEAGHPLKPRRIGRIA